MSTTTAPTYLKRIDSPIGRLELVSDGTAITSVTIEHAGALPRDGAPERHAPVLELAARQLDEYFAGARRAFDLPIVVRGTPFRREVWRVLTTISFGSSLSYGELGRRTGRATAGRAIGGAVGANPVPIIVPCHRVLASDGRITGYSGGEGIITKAWLLRHEGIATRMPRTQPAAAVGA